ncbi:MULTISPECIES: hypothetical protein [unclassified Nocardia]|uniref:hypothetical protein n=1 Tax=unclassified Nocardia TaxID=2637762 RepID=UPI00278C59C1|nr:MULTISPECIES: hypothetical protein [unclassified Nocardia]
MTAAAELLEAIVEAIEATDGLRPVAPFGLDAVTWLPRGGRAYAVDLTKEVVEIRVAATALPLRPLVERLSTAVRALLRDTAWAEAAIRVVVAELDAAAFGDDAVT